MTSLIRLFRPAISFMMVMAAVAWSAPALAAQDASGVQAPESFAEQPTAPVMVDGITLFRVRGVSAYPAERRAAAISDRIAAVAADRGLPAESLVVRETPEGSALVASSRPILHVLDADAQLEGVNRQVLAAAYRGRVAESIERFRDDREGGVVARNLGKALAATFAMLLAFWLGTRTLRLLRRTLDGRYRSKIHDLRFHTIEIVRAEPLWRGIHRALGTIALVLAVLAGYLYLNYVLLLFPWTRTLGNQLSAMLLGPLATLGKGAIGFVPDFVFLVVLAVLTRLVLRAIRLFFLQLGQGSLTLPGFEPEWATPTDRIVRLLVIAFAFVIAYPHIPGSGSEAFKGVTLLLGLLFSLGSPSVIGNIVAGQSLAFRRAFKLGDRVKISEHMGEVTQIRLLSTYLRTAKNEQVVIPNSLILNAEVVNFTALAREPGLILHTIVGIGYETPWRQVEAMLLQAAARTPGLLRQPPPFVLQRTLGTFAVDYELNVYCDSPHLMLVLYSTLHGHIQDVFNEYGVQIMTPAYEGDPEQPKVVAPERWYVEPARPDGTVAAQRIATATTPL
jgi:small-conductance mechanosensitive channel